MNKRFRGTSALDTARRASLACVLGLFLLALWPNAATAQESHFYGIAVIQSATDDGGGKIRVSWTLKDSTVYAAKKDPGPPVKICHYWWWAEDMFAFSTEECLDFPAGEADLVWDAETGKIPGVSAFVKYGVHLAVTYADRPSMPIFGTRAENPIVDVTVNRP